MGNLYITSLKTLDIDTEFEKENNIKTMQILYSDYKYNTKLKFYEVLNKIPNEVLLDEIPINICISDNFPVGNAYGYLNSNHIDKYRLVQNGPCKGFNFRPGSKIIGNLPRAIGKYIYHGYSVKAVKEDFLFNENDLLRCCTQDDKNKCPQILNNNFGTFHCDLTMIKFCTDNPLNEKCLLWLDASSKTSRRDAFYTFYEICKDNYNNQYCFDFSHIAKETYGSFHVLSDLALIEWCKKNSNFKKCKCVNTKNLIDNFEKILGPKECWLKDCTENLRDRSFLTKEQELIRARCKYINCEINIDNIIGKDVTIDILNLCHSFLEPESSSLVIKSKSIPDYNLSFSLLLFLIIIIFLIIFYYRNRLTFPRLNVNRK